METETQQAGHGTRWQAAFSDNETGGTNIWGTPQDFYDSLHAEFDFTLDPAALPENAKCERYFTPDDDGLTQDWGTETVFVNPPYGDGIGDWVRKAALSAQEGATVVLLIFNRSDTKYFHDWILPYASEIRFVKGRLKFGGSKQSAPAPSILVVFRPERRPGEGAPLCLPADRRASAPAATQESLFA